MHTMATANGSWRRLSVLARSHRTLRVRNRQAVPLSCSSNIFSKAAGSRCFSNASAAAMSVQTPEPPSSSVAQFAASVSASTPSDLDMSSTFYDNVAATRQKLPSMRRPYLKLISETSDGGIHPELRRRISDCVKIPQTSVSLQDMFAYGERPSAKRLLESAQFLWREIPIRVAHRIHELDNMPYGLSKQESVVAVRNIYVDSFQTLRSMRRPSTDDEQVEFTKELEGLIKNHANVVPMIAQGLLALKEETLQGIISLEECPYLVSFLDRFYHARIGIRLIAGQHVAMQNYNEGFVGMIAGDCCPATVLRQAAADAAHLCTMTYGESPEVSVVDGESCTFKYMPSDLHYMLVELLKNSMRAVVETHRLRDELPPIKVVIVGGEHEISIKISDQGNGIPRSAMSQIWNYTYTTANNPQASAESSGMYSTTGGENSPMAGFGYGLPLTRLYAKYFGGDLQVIPMDGHGTDAYLFLPRLGGTSEVVSESPYHETVPSSVINAKYFGTST